MFKNPWALTRDTTVLVMVHVVNGPQYRVYTVYIDASAWIAEMESETDSLPRQGQVSMLQITEANTIALYSFRTLDQS